MKKNFQRESQPMSDTNVCAQVKDWLVQEIKILYLKNQLLSYCVII